MIRSNWTGGKKREESILMALKASANDRRAEMIERIAELVKLESLSGNKNAVDRAVSLVAGGCESEQERVKLQR